MDGVALYITGGYQQEEHKFRSLKKIQKKVQIKTASKDLQMGFCTL